MQRMGKIAKFVRGHPSSSRESSLSMSSLDLEMGEKSGECRVANNGEYPDRDQELNSEHWVLGSLRKHKFL